MSSCMVLLFKLIVRVVCGLLRCCTGCDSFVFLLLFFCLCVLLLVCVWCVYDLLQAVAWFVVCAVL